MGLDMNLNYTICYKVKLRADKSKSTYEIDSEFRYFDDAAIVSTVNGQLVKTEHLRSCTLIAYIF